MNVGEANDLNTLLRYVLGIRRDHEVDVDDQEFCDDAEDAAARLAERANKALNAGLKEVDVRDAWQNLELGPWDMWAQDPVPLMVDASVKEGFL